MTPSTPDGAVGVSLVPLESTPARLFPQLDLFAGRERRDRGIELVEGSESSRWMREAAQAIATLAARGEPFCADDVRAMVGDPVHPAAFGAAFLRAVRSDALLYVGRQQSQRPQARGRWLPSYQGVRG